MAQEKSIERAVVDNADLVGCMLNLDTLSNEYAEDDQVYRKKIEVRWCSKFVSSFFIIHVYNRQISFHLGFETQLPVHAKDQTGWQLFLSSICIRLL